MKCDTYNMQIDNPLHIDEVNVEERESNLHETITTLDGVEHVYEYDGALVATFGCDGGAWKYVVQLHDCKVGR